MDNIIFAFLLTLFAGLSTGIGSCLAFFHKKANTKFLAISLGFSAGVMVYVSFVEIFPKARDILVKSMGIRNGNYIAVLSLFGGMLFITLIDKFVPSFENPHEPKDVIDMSSDEDIANNNRKKALLKMGTLSAVAIGVHNFPEGLATFLSAVENPKLGIPIAFAIAIHNIPEGIAVAVPIYFATESRKKAFKFSLLSGLSEPVGAVIGYLVLMP
ncbi:MAG: zinc transporter ZupT, partial [Fusobacteriaceae bacterium]